MKKLLLAAFGTMLALFLLGTAMAGSNAPAKDTSGQSAVSQSQLDTMNKRAEARKQRNKKLKVRAKNLQKAPKSNNELFQKSK